MKRRNREKVLQANGILEGLAYAVSDAVAVALERVSALLEEVLEDEEKGDGRKKRKSRRFLMSLRSCSKVIVHA